MQRSPSRLGNDAALAAELPPSREPANQFVLDVCAAVTPTGQFEVSCANSPHLFEKLDYLVPFHGLRLQCTRSVLVPPLRR